MPEMQSYFIGILPPPAVAKDVEVLKQDLAEKYNTRGALRSPPHITLHMPFNWRADKEDRLIKSLNQFASGQSSLSVSLTGFDCFPPRVIFITVAPNQPLEVLQKALHRWMKTELNVFNAQFRDLPFHPHLTIAFRDLKKDRFAEAWQEYQHKTFQATFHVTQLTLLRHDGAHWQPLRSFDVKNNSQL